MVLQKLRSTLLGIGEKVDLNLNYPKPEKSELRLYISESGDENPHDCIVLFSHRNAFATKVL